MVKANFPRELRGVVFHLVGIKGTGMAALAELLHRRGGIVTGSDREETFYTDEVLKKLGIPFSESFDPSHLPPNLDYLVYSAAYSPVDNPEISEARRLELPIFSYTQALGAISRSVDSVGIAGVHGKTTTTALTGTIAKAIHLPASVLAGAAVPSFGGGSILMAGEEYFIAETCEYKRHFLDFSPTMVVVTNIEADHLDYYKDLDDVEDAFFSYACKLPPEGKLLYCADDPGAVKLSELIAIKRSDIHCIPYGFSASGDYQLLDRWIEGEKNCFRLAFSDVSFSLSIPGEHLALDAAVALAVNRELMGYKLFDALDPGKLASIFDSFKGSSRRSELIGETGGVLFYDDYGHHPTEIRKTLAGLREFFPGRRILVSFMSHTYSRTAALFDQFVRSFNDADMVILHRIYASAREEKGNIDGEALYQALSEIQEDVYFYSEPEEALNFLASQLQEGDLFLTLGAGDNWRLGKSLFERLAKHQGVQGDSR